MTPSLDSISSMSHFPQSSGPYKRGRATKKAKSVAINHGTRPPPWFRIDWYLAGGQRQQIPESKNSPSDWSDCWWRKHTKYLLPKGSVRLATGFTDDINSLVEQISQHFVGNSSFSILHSTLYQKLFCTHQLVLMSHLIPPLPIPAFSFQGIGQASDAINWMEPERGIRRERNEEGWIPHSHKNLPPVDESIYHI